MGKWFFITVLLVIFSDLSAGRPGLPLEKTAGRFGGGTGYPSKSVTLVSEQRLSDQASFSNALPSLPFTRLVAGELVLPAAGCHAGHSPLLLTSFQQAASNRCYRGQLRKQLALAGPLFKDHFHHLFPFFHFW